MNIKEIFEKAQKCERCYEGKNIYVPCPDPKNALGHAKLLFINERPGRIGTGESGFVSFDNNDSSAEFFKECFSQLQIDRKEIFITNACLCHPNYPGYVDTAPKSFEILMCLYWLKLQIDAVKPKLIITLGDTALKSMKKLFPSSVQLHQYSNLKKNIGKVITDTNPWIYPLYHTSRRGRASRKKNDQLRDWQNILVVLSQI